MLHPWAKPCLKVSRILHAGYIFQWENDLIAFDPIFENPFSQNCYAFPSIQFDIEKIKKLKLSAVFISHFHEDHCSLESLNLLDRQTPVYLFCVHPELFEMIKELGFKKVHQIKLNEDIIVGAFKVIPRQALDEDVDSLFQIQVGSLQILNVVDSWIDQKTFKLLLEQGPWDLILWPFQTMRELEVISPSRYPRSSRKLPEEWLEQIRALNPKYLVPSSCQFQMEDWSWYNQAFFPISYQIFTEEIKKILPKTQIVRMNPGVTKELSSIEIKDGEPLHWITPIGNQDVDYSYNHLLKPSLPQEIAKNLPQVTATQQQLVFDFCKQQLLHKWQQLEIDEDDYFYTDKIWKLIVYDKVTSPAIFFYRFLQGKISQISSEAVKDLEYSWLTEISATKLYAALELGESLTSIYIRINDHKFADKIEQELADVDILSDPLLRCLYNGQACSYQKAQLKKLKALIPSP